MTKVCNGCNEKKDLIFFSKDKKRPAGTYPTCKKCINKRQKVYRQNNKEKIKLRKKKYCKKNREEINQKQNQNTANLSDSYLKNIAKRRFTNVEPTKEVLDITKTNVLIWRLKKTIASVSDSKICTNCKELKLKDQFHNNKSTKDGKTIWCKKCIYEQLKNRRNIKKNQK